MKIKRTRYQKGSIRRVPRSIGFAWEVRFSESRNGKRRQKCLTFSSEDYPTEAAVREAIEPRLLAHKQRNAHTIDISPASVGNMHSTRSSCAVMHCGVPTVVIKEK